jgi:hypothetical protein
MRSGPFDVHQSHAQGAGAYVGQVVKALVPPDDDRPPSVARRLSVLSFVFVPWLLLYEWVVYLGPSRHAFETYLPGEIGWPIWQWTEVFYISPTSW